MKRNNKILKYFTLFGAATSFIVPSIIVLTSCGNTSSNFTIATSNDVFTNSVVQLGASFVDSPSTTEFRSVYGALVTYVNEGDYEYNDKGELSNQPIARLVMEAASKIIVYGQENGTGAEKVLLTIDSSDLTNKDAFIVENGAYSINLDKFGEAMINATKVEFTLNKDFKWVDTNGQPKQSLVPLDFWYSLKGYKTSSDYGLNSNGYFLGLAGIDYDKTIAHKENESVEPGSTFTYFIGKTKAPYFLDILTKQYFFPIPHSHPKAAATIETPDNSNVIKFITTNDSKQIIDKNNTDWTKVYGGGQEKDVDVWSIGPYYISASSEQDVIFDININYFNAMRLMYDMNKLDVTKKIPKVIKRYKAGNAISIYDKFGSREVSYAPVPQERDSQAVSRYINTNSLIAIPAPKTSQGRFIGYNLGIYDANGQIKDTNLIGTQYEKFVKNFHTENSRKIRKGINEYINWAFLAEIKYGTGTKDFSLSSIPYGVFPVKTNDNSAAPVDYYQAIGKSLALTIDNNSASPNSGTELIPQGIIGNKYLPMMNQSRKIIADNQSVTDFQNLLTTEGYTKDNPLKLPYWTLVQANNASDTSYFQEVNSVISELSDGAIQFTYKSYDASSTVNNVYYNKSVPMADMLWGPDYNGIGTWIGIYFAYAYNENGTPKDLANKLSNVEVSQDTLVPAYHITNLWKPLYETIKNNAIKQNQQNSNSWLISLKNHLTNTGAALFEANNTYKDIKSNLDTEISIWAGINQSNGINLIDWIDSQSPIIPMYQPSLTYVGYKLVDPKYQVILNLNGDINYRDFVLKY